MATSIDPKVLEKIRPLEKRLKAACSRGALEDAEGLMKALQLALEKYGPSHPRLLEARLWYFECVLDTNHPTTAQAGFVGIRAKAGKGTRLYREATFFLAITKLRRKEVAESKTLLKEVMSSLNRERSAATRRLFQRRVIERIEEEALRTNLIGCIEGPLVPEEVHEGAILFIKTKSEDEVYEALASALPSGSVFLLQDVRTDVILMLPEGDRLHLPAPNQATAPLNIGRRAAGYLQQVVRRTVCDAKSPLYNAWSKKLPQIYSAAYLATAVTSALDGQQIGIKMLAVGLTALLMRSAAAEFCQRTEHRPIMESRRRGEP